MKKTLSIIILITLFVIDVKFLYAQPTDPPTDIPIDGGVSIVLVGGILYGIKKLYDEQRKNNHWVLIILIKKNHIITFLIS